MWKNINHLPFNHLPFTIEIELNEKYYYCIPYILNSFKRNGGSKCKNWYNIFCIQR